MTRHVLGGRNCRRYYSGDSKHTLFRVAVLSVWTCPQSSFKFSHSVATAISDNAHKFHSYFLAVRKLYFSHLIFLPPFSSGPPDSLPAGILNTVTVMFNGTHDCNVFIGQANSHETHNSSGESGIDIILAASTPEAAVDAGERDYEPACCPGTREQYIKDVTSWATTSDSDQLPVYWMKGPAGVGKSAIAQTCAKAMKDSGHLGAAFFFSVNGPRKDHTRFFPTLAYQLATILPDYREVVNRRVLNDKTLVTKTMSSQFESLIVEPLRALKEQGKEVPRRPIFIDGLDECESQDAQAEIIKLIAASAQAKSTPFCWAIFSRADLRIVATFALTRVSSLCQVVYVEAATGSVAVKVDDEVETHFTRQLVCYGSMFEVVVATESVELTVELRRKYKVFILECPNNIYHIEDITPLFRGGKGYK
ncbi:hypothetical protein D9756_006404 [Leucocoprinus leucothites]|uniref:Nephrocystin 3-like N-terminal domain-containing protein n=1 Tax=Leucocoprinus leucothites TaxID=201217 RepID=A0A8H5LGX9_9AGAR|nr:hypothetical protein D9756_006404 [Leucoagaricus leucothites]